MFAYQNLNLVLQVIRELYFCELRLIEVKPEVFHFNLIQLDALIDD